MKLREIEELLNTNHFQLTIVEGNDKAPLFENIPNNTQLNKYSELEVICIDTIPEISGISPITRAVSIRPIIQVVCLWRKNNG